MANATTGVLTSGSLAVSAIGQGMAFACGLAHKHSLKQVDRLLGNERVKVWDYFAQSRYLKANTVKGAPTRCSAQD